MILFRILVLSTLLVVAGYFIQLTAQRAEGFLKPFGKYLSLWVFALAGLVIVAAALEPVLGDRGFGMMRGGPGFMMRGGPGFERGFGPGARPGFFPGRGFGPHFERQDGGRFGGRGAPPPADGAAPAPAPQAAPATP